MPFARFIETVLVCDEHERREMPVGSIGGGCWLIQLSKDDHEADMCSLSDESSVIPGSLGLLPSASLAGAPDPKSTIMGVYEP